MITATTGWPSVGTVVGNTSPYEFSFVLKSFACRVGDIVAVPMEMPGSDGGVSKSEVYAWGRITAIDRFNPFFPHEAAQELAHADVPLLDTVLSNSRDQLQAEVLVLGITEVDHEGGLGRLYPAAYPIEPTASVVYPPADVVENFLGTDIAENNGIRVGSLRTRSDVAVTVRADKIVARHMAILAMTGGGKTVAARRILRELIDKGYPVLIFDPHGDYVGFWKSRKELFPNTAIRLFYPHVAMDDDSRDIVSTFVSKMTSGLTEPQQEVLNDILEKEAPKGSTLLGYIDALKARVLSEVATAPGNKRATYFVVRRSLAIVGERLRQMENTNEQMRRIQKDLTFEELPDPRGTPEQIVRPGQVSILYLGGYDHLTQTTLVSVVMEALFAHRANLSGRIAPFMTVLEEAHTFIPSAREGTEDAPSLSTLRKVITEGRKFGTGLLLITQRPSRVDETILSQCNTFLVLRLVNPKDQSFVRTVMENLSDSDSKLLPGFGPGEGLISGQAVRFPLLVKIKHDLDLENTSIGDENFFEQVAKWKPDAKSASRANGSAVASAFKNGKRPKPKR